MHFNKTNHFYLEHALGIHLCPLHGPHFAYDEGGAAKKALKNSGLDQPSGFHDRLLGWFENLGRDSRWMLFPEDRSHPLLQAVREEHAKRRRFSRRLAQSPMAPESVWRLARVFQTQFSAIQRWAVLDDDHHLAWTMRQNQIEADAFVMQLPKEQASFEGLVSHRDHTFWEQNWLAGFHQANRTYSGAVIDTLHVDNMLHFALLRTQELLEPDGVCAVLFHPWQRNLMAQLADLLNFELVDAHSESIMRYGPHFVPHEILWDVNFYRAKGTNTHLDPQKIYSRKAAKNFEPSSHLVGAGTLDQLTPNAPRLRQQALALLQKGAKIKVLTQETRGDNTFWTLPNGGLMALHHPEGSGRLQVDFSPWRPRLLTQFTTAMLTYFDRPSPYMELP